MLESSAHTHTESEPFFCVLVQPFMLTYHQIFFFFLAIRSVYIQIFNLFFLAYYFFTQENRPRLAALFCNGKSTFTFYVNTEKDQQNQKRQKLIMCKM